MSSGTPSGSGRQAAIVKLWSQGMTRKLIRERLRCGAAAIDEALGELVWADSGGAPSRTLPLQAFWTPERVERARAMWLGGESAAAIGARLGLSRNAVIGKLSRLGVGRRDEVARAIRERGSRKGAAKAAAKRARPELKLAANPSPRPVEPEPEPLTDLMGLKAHMCRWPIGEPGDEGFGYCGRRAAGSFCPDHKRRAYVAGPLEPIERLAGIERRAAPRSPGREQSR